MEAYQTLEAELAAWTGYEPEQVVACSSGTAALHLALEAFQLPLGSEVIVPDFTMVACARAVTLAGLTPVFIDCDDDLLMNNGLVQSQLNWDAKETVQENYLRNKVRVLMAVHIYGRQCNMSRLMTYGPRTFQPYFIEDLAEAHGVKPHPLADAACWSFYLNKIVAGEEGGAVAFRDVEHANLARSLRSLGFTDSHDFMHHPRGHNYRMSNCHAELIRRSLSFLPENLERRRVIESWYDCYCPLNWRMPPRDVAWVYDLRIVGMKYDVQDRVVKALRGNGIEARHSFKRLSLQQEYEGCRVVEDSPNRAGLASWEVIYLPIQPGVTTESDCRRSMQIVRATVDADG